MEFQNTREMQDAFSSIIKIAIEDVTKQMETRIKDEIDLKDIGGSFNGEGYESTGEFREAWVQTAPQKLGGDVYEGGLHYEPSLIKTHNTEKWQHDSQVQYWDGLYVDEFLPNILFETGAKPIWGENKSTKPRDAWSPMLSSIDRSFSKILRDSFKRHSITLTTDSIAKYKKSGIHR